MSTYEKRIPLVICPKAMAGECEHRATLTSPGDCDHSVPHYPLKNRCGSCNNWLDLDVCKRRGTRPCCCVPV